MTSTITVRPDILALIDRYGRTALERLSRQAENGNREAAEILVRLAAEHVWTLPPRASVLTDTPQEVERHE